MGKKYTTTINTDEILSIFKEYCKENKFKFSENKFEEFLKFLEIDFYDWVKGNNNQFYQQEQK